MNKLTKVLMITLRIAIGWHFLYEGVFKLGLDDAWRQPMTAHYYLQSSVARLHNDTAGLAPGPARERMLQWSNDVAGYFGRRGAPLGDEQKTKLAMLRYSAAPDSVDAAWVHDDVLALNKSGGGSGAFSAEPFLRNSWGPFRPVYRAMISDVDGFGRLTPAHAARTLDTRYADLVKHYGLNDEQSRKLAAVRDALKRSVTEVFAQPDLRARLADYRVMLVSLREAERQSYMPFASERVQTLRKRADDTCASLLAYVTEPADELTAQAQQLLTISQWKAGLPKAPPSQTGWLDVLIPWSLVIIGVCLMLGFCTMPAAIAAAMLLATFYFAMPPWPGLPTPPGEGHYLIVNSNLIEMIAVLLVGKGVGR